MRRISSIFRSIEDWVAGFLIVSGLSVMLYQVFLRYVLKFPTTWQDEVSRYLIVWGALIGSAVAIRDNQHIKVDILYQFFPRTAKKITDIFASLVMLAFFSFLIFYGSILVKDKFITGQSSFSGFKLWLVYIVLPLSGVLMFLQTLSNIFNINKKDDDENTDTNTI